MLSIRSVAAASLVAAAGMFAIARAQGPAGPGSGAPAGVAGPTAGARPEDTPGPVILGFAAQGNDWYWLRRRGADVELMRGGARTAPTTRARGQGWQGLALAGGQVFVFERAGKQANLLRIPSGGGSPTPVVAGRQNPDGLRGLGDQVFWVEWIPEARPDLTFIPLLGPRLRLCVCPAAGNAVRVLGEWPAEATVEKLDPLDPEILGIAGDAVYFRMRRRLATEFYRVPLSGGEPVRVASEAQDVNGILADGRFCWIAPSEEATPASGLRCVRKSGPDGTAVTVCEWLTGKGRLFARGKEIFYSADWLYAIPERLDLPRPLRKMERGQIAADGDVVIHFDDAGQPTPVK